VTASDFHGIAIGNDASKAERLFRASVSAFCTLTRPSRREVVQLEDLTLPLYDEVSPEARRYVAAALSECAVAPARLVERLANDRVDIAAPLLARSEALTDVDLIALIGKHGLSHARVIARRAALNPTIAQLIRALEAVAPKPLTEEGLMQTKSSVKTLKKDAPQSRAAHKGSSVSEGIAAAVERAASMVTAGISGTVRTAATLAASPASPATRPGRSILAGVPAERLTAEGFAYSPLPPVLQRPAGQAEDAARDRLRSMMEPASQESRILRKAENRTFAKLRDAAFTGSTAAFQAALCETLGLTPATVGKITDTSSYSPLLAALRSLYLGDEQIFMIAAAVFPARFAHPESIRLFAERCRSLSQEVAAERVRGWKREALANQLQWEEARMKRA
jgi:uncharacterized protein (DUF2336 family)